MASMGLTELLREAGSRQGNTWRQWLAAGATV